MKQLILFMISALLATSVQVSWADKSDNTPFPIEQYDQQISNWIDPLSADYDTPVSMDNSVAKKSWQTLQFEGFYNHYFGASSPWDKQYIHDVYHAAQTDYQTRDIASTQLMNLKNKSNYIYIYDKDSNQYTQSMRKVIGSDSNKNLGYESYDINAKEHPDTWIDDLEKNMDLSQFAGDQQYSDLNRAITTDNLNARVLPTDDIYSLHASLAGEGYPFDYLQMSVIWAGTPIYILGESKDKQWALVVSPDLTAAWVKSSGITRVNTDFVEEWRAKAKKGLVAVVHTELDIKDEEDGTQRFKGYVGQVFPLESQNDSGFHVLIPPTGQNQIVTTSHHALLANGNAVLMPLSPTPHHFVDIMHQLIGRGYGWGNLEFKNDCSGETKKFYAPFGIWLPRNSSYQVDPSQGVIGTLDDYTQINGASTQPEQRIQRLIENGHKFTTIIAIPGHIFMYVGNYHNPSVALTYQNIWGLRGINGPDKRFVIGKAVLLPLLSTYPEDKNISSLAAKLSFKIMYLDVPAIPMTTQSLEQSHIRKRQINLRALMVPEQGY